MEDVNEYVIRKVYKGEIIEVKVRDCFIRDQRITTISCLKYNSLIVGLSNATDEQINKYIDRNFNIAHDKISSDKCIVKKLVKIFR